jgi:LysR family hydrogen peroxide-inducible transcriptional activator
VRIGAIPTIAPYFLPSLLARFGREFPEASALVDEDTTDKLLKKLSDGVVDVAFLARPLEARYLDVVDLFEEELFLLLSAGHPLVERKQVRLADIEALPFILLGEAHCLTDNIVTFCRQRSFHPMSVERTSQLATVQELVALGHGVSLVPRMARMVDSDPRRVYRSLAGTRPTRTVAMAFNPYRFQSRLLEGFKSLARKHATEN